MRRRLRGTGPDDAGAVSVFVLGLIVVLMVVAGLVIDGGRAVNARAEIMDDAEQAARTGANQIDPVELRASGQVRILPGAASAAAADYLTARGYDPGRIAVSSSEAQVEVTVRDTVPTSLLQLILIPSFEVEGSAVSRAAVGIVAEIPSGAP